MSEIKAIFTIQEDSDLAGVRFTYNGRRIFFEDLPLGAKTRMLDTWARFYNIFLKNTKQIYKLQNEIKD